MRLTKRLKESAIKQILADIPKTDFDEQMRKFIYEDSYNSMPSELLTAIEADESVIFYLHDSYYCTSYHSTVRIVNCKYEPSEESIKIINNLEKKYIDQADNIRNIRIKLEASFNGITTTKQLAEFFPEFVKYFPADEKQMKNLPATTELMDELRSAGWPK